MPREVVQPPKSYPLWIGGARASWATPRGDTDFDDLGLSQVRPRLLPPYAHVRISHASRKIDAALIRSITADPLDVAKVYALSRTIATSMAHLPSPQAHANFKQHFHAQHSHHLHQARRSVPLSPSLFFLLTPLRPGLRRGAYAGLSASILRQMTYSLTRFGVYDALKARLSADLHPGEQLPAWKMALAASVAGGLGGIAGNPADVILVRMTGDANRKVGERLGYKHWSVLQATGEGTGKGRGADPLVPLSICRSFSFCTCVRAYQL